mmetsp:Transcript_65236/g.155594  ORF Transcript_65236/g.155594 Transcript_65236/m.155594 type:complete len:429 (+) Transcript_65236:102-1388(+)
MEFQVVILAGGTGTRLYPLTEHTTKSLLPVANRPLVSYQLALLERSGFKEALVATTPAAKEAMDFFLSNDYKGDVQVEVCVVDEDMETADVLRCLKDKITRDFVVVSGDLITDVFLHHLADVHRIHDATCTVLLRAPKPVNLPTGSKAPKVEGATLDFVGLDEKRSRLLVLESAADVDEKLVVPRRVLRAFPNITITNKMLDAHFYIFSHWVLELLKSRPELTSIKSELIPFLLAHQFSPEPVLNPGQPLLDADGSLDEDDMDVERPDQFRPIQVHCLVYDSGYCSRADSLHSYKEMNLEVPRHQGHGVPWASCVSFPDKVEDEKKLLFKKVGGECVVGEGFTIGDKSSIKKSVIGKHCTIGSNVKIVNSIIHSHVKIQDNVTLTGCVVCDNAYIDSECTLTNCQVGSQYSVEAESTLKNDSLVVGDD